MTKTHSNKDFDAIAMKRRAARKIHERLSEKEKADRRFDNDRPTTKRRDRPRRSPPRSSFRSTMPTVTLNFPETLHERLKEQAEQHHRDPDSEALRILERVLMPSHMSAEEAIAEAKALNDRIGKTFPDLVNEAKREGRA